VGNNIRCRAVLQMTTDQPQVRLQQKGATPHSGSAVKTASLVDGATPISRPPTPPKFCYLRRGMKDQIYQQQLDEAKTSQDRR
jgi:hypothetical protein